MNKKGANRTQGTHISQGVKTAVGKHVLKGLRNAIIVAGIAVAVLLIAGTVFAIVTNRNIGKCMYMSCYYGSIFVLLVSIPQFYKRNESGKIRKIRQMDTMFGFYGWFGNKYNDEVMEKSFDQFKGDGFWLGIMLVSVGMVILAMGVLLENIFFV